MRIHLALLFCASCGDNLKPPFALDANSGDGPVQVDAFVSGDGTPAGDAAPTGDGGCTPVAASCTGNQLVGCDNTGAPTSSACALGCTDGAARCNELAPTNLSPTVCETAGAANLVVASGTTSIDTSGACTAVVTQTGGPAICVMIYKDVSVSAGATLKASGTRALAIVSTGAIDIAGTLDVSAGGRTPGPGAPLASGNGAAGGATSSGGGGAGGQVVGAAGASATAAGGGGAGGAVTGTPALSPLVTGSSGGANGGGAIGGAAAGGAGGGGLQLVACGPLAIAGSGIIDAGGGGGAGGAGTTAIGTPGAGGGGGGGGAILIEAASINLAGLVAADGGGGGGGGTRGANVGTGANGLDGQEGGPTSTPAGGGTGADTSGAGGAGGAGTTAATGGSAASVSTGAGGGGGGAVGRIRLNTVGAPSVTGTVSPAASTGAVAVH